MDPATRLVVSLYDLPYHNGIVTWLGIDWYGIPYPLRLYVIAWRVLAVTSRGETVEVPSPDVFAGCGCIKRLKDWVTR
jgi:hypothetical protein